MTPVPRHGSLMAPANGDTALVLPLAEQHRAVMAFSLRTGGCSPPPYGTLNFSVQQGDTPENVTRNHQILGAHLGIDPHRIATCRQVHGDEVAVLEDVPPVRPQVDAMIGVVPNLYLAIKTADCVPILLMDPIHGVCAAVHAGWRGTVKRIARKTVRIMKDTFHCREEDIVAALGPAIGRCCYEVDDAVLVPFSRNVPDGDRFIAKVRKHGTQRDAYTLDLVATNRAELTREGIPPANIHEAGLCTSCSPDLLFSYRRDGKLSGRHMSLVGFTP
jgi:polyphenol oxidase